MYIIQELSDKGIWEDRYSNTDYDLILEFLSNFRDKYPKGHFRLVEEIIYVWVMWTIFNSRDSMSSSSFWCLSCFFFFERFIV